MTLAQRCGADGPARQAAGAELLRRLQEQHITQVRVVWADVHGSYRSKTLVAESSVLKAALQNGIGMVSTLFLKDTADHTAFKVFEPDAMGVQGVSLDAMAPFRAAGNVLLLPDPSSLTVLPWAPGTAWLRADPFWSNGSAVAADCRGVLQRAVAQLAAWQGVGYQLKCGLEIEFHIYQMTDDALASAHAAWPAEPPVVRHLHPGFQLLSDSHADMTAAPAAIVWQTALALGLPMQSLEIEFGPSQFEAVFAPADALTTADRMLMFRNGVRQALRRAGYHASFVCRPPLPNSVASGWHLHQSLVNAQGQNLMAAQVNTIRSDNVPSDLMQTLSPLGQHWLAGLLAHAQGMTALCAPTQLAYSRYQGSVMAPQFANWGYDSRGVMLRVLGEARPGGDPNTRIENRLPEPLANPYLMVAAQIFAGLDGLQRSLWPGRASAAACATAQSALPQNLGAALEAFEANSVMQQGLGPCMAEVFGTIKRQELQRHAQAQDQALWERCEYFARY
jgi:glutamine synthetase